MDAANPLCRWLFAVGLAAAIGCHSSDNAFVPLARAQAPAGPVAPLPPASPLAPVAPAGPLAPSAPVVPASPNVPGSPVQGFPVPAGSPDPNVKTTGAFTVLPNVRRAAELMKDGVPQIRVVAYIGASNLITDQEVIEAVRQRLTEFRDLPGSARVAKEKEIYNSELRRIIERELILDDMYGKLKKQGRLAVIDEIKEFAEKASDQSMRAIRKGYGLNTEAEFLSVLQAQGLTLPVIRRQIERQIMADEYVRSALKEKGRIPGFAEIRAYYNQHPDEFQTADQVKWLDIFISFNKHATPQAAYQFADKVRLEAANGADFIALVKQHDNGLAAGAGGVGVGSKRGEIQPVDVEPAVWSLRPGEVSKLIETPAGYHIVKVAEREYAGLRTLDVKAQSQVRERLIRQYREEEYLKLIEELWRKGAVRVLDVPQ